MTQQAYYMILGQVHGLGLCFGRKLVSMGTEFFIAVGVSYQFPMVSAVNRPCSIYQYSNMAPRLSGQTSIFGVVFFVFKSLLGIERQKKLKKFTILTRKPRIDLENSPEKARALIG